MERVPLGIHVTTNLSFDKAEQALREALSSEGFGILTEVDVRSVLKQKLDVDVDAYKILGACHPETAYEALKVWKGFGLLAPCNLVLYDAGDHRVVQAVDLSQIDAVREQGAVYPIAQRAAEALERALQRFEESAAT